VVLHLHSKCLVLGISGCARGGSYKRVSKAQHWIHRSLAKRGAVVTGLSLLEYRLVPASSPALSFWSLTSDYRRLFRGWIGTARWFKVSPFAVEWNKGIYITLHFYWTRMPSCRNGSQSDMEIDALCSTVSLLVMRAAISTCWPKGWLLPPVLAPGSHDDALLSAETPVKRSPWQWRNMAQCFLLPRPCCRFLVL